VLAEPERTPYDLHFRLLGVSIRVHPFFWLGAALLGQSSLNLGLEYLAIWMAVVFVSLLVHELGHALAYRHYGSNSRIVLYIFFGLAIGSPDVRGKWRRVMVSLAGPCAGFVFAGLIYGSHLAVDWGGRGSPSIVRDLYYQLLFVNVAWGVFNLFPVFPLDGGQVSRDLCEGRWPGRGLRLSLQISVGTAATMVIYSLMCASSNQFGWFLDDIPWYARGTFYTAVLFALLGVQSYLLLRQTRRGSGYYYEAPDDRLPWEK